jgi:hypothetical protein
MFQCVRDNPGIIIIVNILFSYGLYNCCASILWQLFIYDDVQHNSKYAYDTDTWLISTMIAAAAVAYATNATQLVFMTVQYSRHFGCIGTVINQFIFAYGWVALSVIEGGCKEREWLSCYKNETSIVDNTAVTQSKTHLLYGIMFLNFIEVVFCICSYIKNKNNIYYFYPDCREVPVMIMFHYSVAIVYSLLPLVMWCGFCLLSDSDSGGGGGGGSGGVYFDYIHTGRSYPNKAIRKEQVDAGDLI